jgi:hypothetical protein
MSRIAAGRRPVAALAWPLLTVAAITGCDVETPLRDISLAQHTAADLSVQFTKALDASNLAVMAGSDDKAKSYAGAARQRTASVQKDIEALRPVLQRLQFTDEQTQLDAFARHFDEYRAVDGNILDLAVENTNLKAQGLLFGASQQAVDAVRQPLAALEPSGDTREAWRVRALAAGVISGAREIQALQAPHIAEPDEAVMAQIEKRLAAAEAAARRDLADLKQAVRPASAPDVVEASAALDRLMEVNRQIISLSRRNSNVRSVALSLNQKRTIAAACEQQLHALQTALSKRGFVGTR